MNVQSISFGMSPSRVLTSTDAKKILDAKIAESGIAGYSCNVKALKQHGIHTFLIDIIRGNGEKAGLPVLVKQKGSEFMQIDKLDKKVMSRVIADSKALTAFSAQA